MMMNLTNELMRAIEKIDEGNSFAAKHSIDHIIKRINTMETDEKKIILDLCQKFNKYHNTKIAYLSRIAKIPLSELKKAEREIEAAVSHYEKLLQ